MSARREVSVGDRVTVGKRRRRFVVVAIVRPPEWWTGSPRAAPPSVAVIVERSARHAYAAPKSKRRGQGRRVPLAKLVRS